MWDDTRKVGILNDFDLARFGDQVGASGQDNTGTLPFMALDLLSKGGLHGEIPRRYRHEAESFAWCLICLYIATVEDGKGRNRTRNPHPLLKWFQSWDTSLDAKKGLEWHRLDLSGVPPAYPNAMDLARNLHKYWMDRYNKQFPEIGGANRGEEEEAKIMEMFNPKLSRPIEIPPYEEPEEENLLGELLVIHARSLGWFEPTKELVTGIGGRYKELDWTP